MQHRAQVRLAAGAFAAAGHVEAEPERLRTAWLAHTFTLTAKMETVTVTEPRVRRGRSARSEGSTVAVTGAAGPLGQLVLERLVSAGRHKRVVAIDVERGEATG